MENKIILNTQAIRRAVNRNGFVFDYTNNQLTEPKFSSTLIESGFTRDFENAEGSVLVCLECSNPTTDFDDYNQVITTKREIIANYIGDDQWEVSEEILLNKVI